MWQAIIVACITAIGSLLGVYISNNKNQALIAYRLEQLEKKVDQHNKVIERTYDLEKEDVKQNERLAHLEEEIKGIEKD